jgi:molecular chaperone GrpE (heat shock protein)
VASTISPLRLWHTLKIEHGAILKMPKKRQTDTPAATAADIERSIQALNKMAERLWGDGREAEAKALLDALDALNRALDRIRIGESRRVLH